MSTGRNPNPGMPENRFEGSTTTGTVGAIKDKAQEVASGLACKVEEAWDSTKQGVQQAASTVATTAEGAFNEVTRFMRTYPFATLCAGVGLGFVLSQLMRNRTS